MKILLTVLCLINAWESFSQNDSALHSLKVKLIKAEPSTPHCGVIAWALTQKFEIIESDFSYMKPKYPILLNKSCPEFLGPEYFITNRVYLVKVAENSGAPFGYSVINNYQKEKLPIFWIREIKLVIN